jgi:hypothetical protein
MSYSIKDQAGTSVFTSIGTVNSEESNKDAQLFQMPIPLSDSTNTVMLDLFGASRTIIIKGRFTTTDGTISTFISELDALVNGQQSVKVYHSDKSGSDYNVLIQGARWSSAEGGVNFVDYTIEMIQGST